jgi:hypothetical protein
MTYLRKPLLAVFAALVAMAMVVPAAQAATPAPGYTQFAGCPSPEENPATQVCLRAVIKSGNFKMGSKNVPISKPMTMSGGLDAELHNFSANSKGGFPPVQQQVPGGVIGITGLDWLVNFLDIDSLQLFAVTELAGKPEITFDGLEMPIRVRLVNPVLGSKCYVGTLASPIKLKLIEKVSPEFIEEPSGILKIQNGVFSDTTFSAPGANGCVLTLFGFIPISVNGLVNSQSGLPAATGNETNQNIDMELVSSELVYP